MRPPKTDFSPVWPVFYPDVDVQWLLCSICKKIYDLQVGHKRYLDVVVDDTGFPSEVPADVVAQIDNAFAQKAH